MAYIGTQPKDIRSFGKAKFDFTATQGQTAFTGADDDGKTLGFTAGQVSVYVNGILMDDSDYTASNGNTITLASAANASDIISVVALQTDIPNSDYVPATGGTFSGAVTLNGGVTGGVDVTGTVTAERLTLGTDSGDAFNAASLLRIQGAPDVYGSIKSATTGIAGWTMGDTDDDVTAGIFYNNASNYLYLLSNNAERLRIDSFGNVLVGTTSTSPHDSSTEEGLALRSDVGGFLAVSRSGSYTAAFNRMSNDGELIQYRQNGVTVGSVSVTSSGTTYNTASDRRLKTDIKPIADATDKLMAMNPVSHKWKADPEADAVVGFIAQEMQEIIPEAVSGTPDGEEMMAMDYGRITPVLVAALQDAMKEITALKERVAELEAN